MSPHHTRSLVHPSFDLNHIQSWLERDVEWGGDLSLQSVGLNRLWVGRHARLSFELALGLLRDGKPHTLMLQGGQRSKCRTRQPVTPRPHTRGRVSRNGLTGLRLVSHELDMWCCTPDRDWRLRAVHELLDDAQASSVLAETAAASALGLGRQGSLIRCHVESYRAGKRCAMLARSTGSCAPRHVFVKVFRRPPSTEQLKSNGKLASFLGEHSSGVVRMPAYIDVCTKKRLLITEAVPKESRSLENNPQDIAAAGTVLATLHDAPIEFAPKIHTPIDEYQTACRWVGALRILSEPGYLQLRNLVIALSDRLAMNQTPAPVLLHRDYFASQLLRTGETVWLLDLDTLSHGHPEVDVSTFVAHLFLDGVVAGVAKPDIVECGADFVDSYLRSGGRLDKSRLRFYLPCALARLGAIHLARGMPAPLVDELWELARGYLDGSWALV